MTSNVAREATIQLQEFPIAHLLPEVAVYSSNVLSVQARTGSRYSMVKLVHATNLIPWDSIFLSRWPTPCCDIPLPCIVVNNGATTTCNGQSSIDRQTARPEQLYKGIANKKLGQLGIDFFMCFATDHMTHRL